jgi:hypothetical protein
MTSPNVSLFCEQTGALALSVLCILVVLGVSGAGVVGWLLPRFFRVRWIVFAPLAGLAVITIVSLPLSLLGLPAGTYAWPLLLSLAAVSVVSGSWAFLHTRSRRRRHVLLAYLRHGGPWLAVGFVGVMLLSAKMITNGGRSKADGVWGSSDFGSYWTVAAYLQQHGAELAEYEAQPEFQAGDIDDHLRRHARLGCMTTLAVLGHAISPGRLPALLNPLIVASLWLLVALVQVFAGRERLGRSTAVLLGICHPFLYFLLLYSYHSQAFSVLLIAAGLLIAEISGRQPAPATWPRGYVAAGLFFAAAILHYPSAFLAPLVFLGGRLLFHLRRGGLTGALICGATVLLAAGYHLPRTYRELAWLGRAKELPGWDWQRLVGVHELLGLRSLTHFEPLPAGDLTATVVTLAVSLLVGAALLSHLRRGALPFSAAALLLAAGVLAVSGYVKYRQGVPHATHGLAKAVSQYALFILLFATAGTVAAFPSRIRQARLLALIVLGGFVVIQSLQITRWRRAAWYDYDLITLVERHRGETMPLAFDPELDDRLVAPLVRDERRLMAKGRVAPHLRFTLASNPAVPLTGAIVDREGRYVAVRSTRSGP